MRVVLVVLLVARIAAAQAPTPAAPAAPTAPATPAAPPPAPPAIDPSSDVSGPALPPPAPASTDPAVVLRDANAAATAGDWAKVSALVDPLLARPLEQTDLAEAHRLAGLAAFFANQTQAAEQHFLAYLRIDLDGHLDPALYPPEVLNFFNDVRAKHNAELRALRPPPKRYLVLSLLPPWGQFQNGEHTKGWIVGGLLAATLATNVTTFFVIRSWCHNPGSTCDDSGPNHYRGAERLSTLNVLSGIGFLATYAYGVWDGVRGYRRRTMFYAAPTSEGPTLGVVGRF